MDFNETYYLKGIGQVTIKERAEMVSILVEDVPIEYKGARLGDCGLNAIVVDNPHDDNAFASTIIKLLADDELYRTFSENALSVREG